MALGVDAICSGCSVNLGGIVQKSESHHHQGDCKRVPTPRQRITWGYKVAKSGKMSGNNCVPKEYLLSVSACTCTHVTIKIIKWFNELDLLSLPPLLQYNE
jgi:hypothetical protein